MKKVLILSEMDRLPVSNAIKENNDIVIFKHDLGGSFSKKHNTFEIIVDHSNPRNVGTMIYSQDIADWI